MEEDTEVVVKVVAAKMTKRYYLLFGGFALALLFTGCSFTNLSGDTDRDGVANYKDICKATPAGAKVDAQGCALDTDFDGVIDLYDKCPGTTASQLVNKYGCTQKVL
ncbi:MAG: hypothetical protein GXP61_07955 [Epsilonproteobacteria bacterium]|nr:hypothetical protein [Campylobacterota bacterium]